MSTPAHHPYIQDFEFSICNESATHVWLVYTSDKLKKSSRRWLLTATFIKHKQNRL